MICSNSAPPSPTRFRSCCFLDVDDDDDPTPKPPPLSSKRTWIARHRTRRRRQQQLHPSCPSCRRRRLPQQLPPPRPSLRRPSPLLRRPQRSLLSPGQQQPPRPNRRRSSPTPVFLTSRFRRSCRTAIGSSSLPSSLSRRTSGTLTGRRPLGSRRAISPAFVRSARSRWRRLSTRFGRPRCSARASRARMEGSRATGSRSTSRYVVLLRPLNAC